MQYFLIAASFAWSESKQCSISLRVRPRRAPRLLSDRMYISITSNICLESPGILNMLDVTTQHSWHLFDLQSSNFVHFNNEHKRVNALAFFSADIFFITSARFLLKNKYSIFLTIVKVIFNSIYFMSCK